MEETEFIFRCRPLTGETLLPQVSRAVQQRTALLAQEECPEVRRLMDRLEQTAIARSRVIRRGRLLGVLALAVGLGLLAMGLAKPVDNLAWWMVGSTAAMVLGAWGCVRYRKAPKTAFDLAAEHLLASRALIGDDQVRILFRPETMTIEQDHRGEPLPYHQIQLAVETQDTWLLAFGARAMVLLKRDLVGDPAAFSSFLAERVHCVQALDCP